jgi:lysophospholipase L1-like esterase
MLSAGDARAAASCAAPRDMMRLQGPLSRTMERIRANQPLKIVAIGSSSTAGFGASSPAHSYPSQLAAQLAQRFPTMAITVLNKGVGGEIAQETLRRFDSDVIAEKPDLVIWQVGTNDVMHELDLPAYRNLVRSGIEKLKAAGADVMLLDLQYAPKVLAHPLYPEVERVLTSLSKEEGVPVFQRFAIMRHWHEDEQVGFPNILSGDGLHMNDFSYDCLAQLMAGAIGERAAASVVTSRH